MSLSKCLTLAGTEKTKLGFRVVFWLHRSYKFTLFFFCFRFPLFFFASGLHCSYQWLGEYFGFNYWVVFAYKLKSLALQEYIGDYMQIWYYLYLTPWIYTHYRLSNYWSKQYWVEPANNNEISYWWSNYIMQYLVWLRAPLFSLLFAVKLKPDEI